MSTKKHSTTTNYTYEFENQKAEINLTRNELTNEKTIETFSPYFGNIRITADKFKFVKNVINKCEKIINNKNQNTIQIELTENQLVVLMASINSYFGLQLEGHVAELKGLEELILMLENNPQINRYYEQAINNYI